MIKPTQAVMLNQNQAARRLGVAKATLAKWRSLGHPNIPYIKLGRCIRYKSTDLDTYITKHTVNSAEA